MDLVRGEPWGQRPALLTQLLRYPKSGSAFGKGGRLVLHFSVVPFSPGEWWGAACLRPGWLSHRRAQCLPGFAGLPA